MARHDAQHRPSLLNTFNEVQALSLTAEADRVELSRPPPCQS